MPDDTLPPFGLPRFDRAKVRSLKLADADPAARLLTNEDIELLLAFLWQFAAFGWLPPATDEQRQALLARDLAVHTIESRTFYEFRSRGPRDDREPTLTLFFHLDAATATVRIIGYYETRLLSRDRSSVLDLMFVRAGIVDRIIRRGP